LRYNLCLDVLRGGELIRAIAFILLLTSVGALPQVPRRPKITGIDHVAFYTTSAEANEHFYMSVLGVARTEAIEPGQTQTFVVGTQWVGYSPAPDPKSTNRMNHVAFRTEDCDGMRTYLSAKGLAVPDHCSAIRDGARIFSLTDPEGHTIEFVQQPKFDRLQGPIPASVSQRMIHAGFIVRNREAEDHFYKDLLGFHLYWQGGMQPDRTDWVAMQVPDGTDWVEYMVNVKADPDLHTTGVMNHISLGVHDIKAAQAKLETHGWKPHGPEHAQLGKDGKWQLNLYDPDQTRIELMEFTPAEKPCCSEFQGKHPSESE
jgi:catechol 2,3-dioxygenase-like lactoylglutathione lyase family enzyme